MKRCAAAMCRVSSSVPSTQLKRSRIRTSGAAIAASRDVRDASSPSDHIVNHASTSAPTSPCTSSATTFANSDSW
jgi:hypothetical protein